MCVLSGLSHVRLYATLWTVACQAPLSVGFSRQEHWSQLPCTSQGDLPCPGIEPFSLMSPALVGRFFTTSTTWEVPQTRTEDEHPRKISGLVLMWLQQGKEGRDQNSLEAEAVALANCVGMGATVIQVPQTALLCWLLPNITT